eukprot:s7960_g3.t1
MLAFRTTQPSWGAAVTDIRQAFVLAPWIGKAVALKPPALAVEMGLAETDDYWLVKQSIYGLREAPAAWASFRDTELEAARWKAKVDGTMVELKLKQLVSDSQVWKVVRTDGENDDALGYLLVYVDDLMIMGPEGVMESFFGWLSNKWECDDLSILSEKTPIKFLGMELHLVNGGIEVSQEGFIRELLRSHNHDGSRSKTQGKFLGMELHLVNGGIEVSQEGFIRELLRSHNHDGSRSKTQGPRDVLIMSPEEEAMMLEAQPANLEGKEHIVKEAQRRVGEMLWLSSRSRPDIQYATSVMSSRITRCPEAVVTIGERLLSYLNETMFERHLRVRANWIRERIQQKEIYVRHEPGATQCADIGTKPFTKDRLAQLKELWSIRNRRPSEGVVAKRLNVGPWMKGLAILTQVCGAEGREDGIQPEVPWDLYIVIVVMSIAVIGLWEAVKYCLKGRGGREDGIQPEVPWDLYIVIVVMSIAVIGLWEAVKYCLKGRGAQVRTLRARADNASKRLTRNELKELQVLMSLDPQSLDNDQKLRLFDLKELFDETMPSNTSPAVMVSALNLETAGELKTSSMMGHQCRTSVGKREAVKDPRDTIALVTSVEHQLAKEKLSKIPGTRSRW